MSLNLVRVLSIALLIAAPATAMAQSGLRQQTRSSYGSWNNSWGARPANPPRSWSKNGDWYRHVRACRQRYRSYNSKSDTYRTNSGHARRCTL